MLPDPFAFRPGAPDPPPDVAPPSLGAAPERMAVPTTERRGPRLRRISASTLVSGVVHAGLAVAFLVIWHAMMKAVASSPEPIAVEIVRSIPGETTQAAPAPAPAPASAPKAQEQKAPDPKAQEPPAPPPPPADKAEEQTPDPPPPSPQSRLDEALKPALAPPPPEAKAAATQATTSQDGNAAKAPEGQNKPAAGSPDAAPAPAREQAAPEAVPEVLSAPDAATSVPAPAPKPDVPKPAAKGEADSAQRDATAQLAAALPMASMPMPVTFRAALSAQGTSNNAEYRGSVFGAIGRVSQDMGVQAAERRLKGAVGLAIELTATGAIAKVSIIQSSGKSAVDAFAMEVVRRAAPFPPPPPGAPRTFTPAIIVGQD